jgi:hypothetical protein
MTKSRHPQGAVTVPREAGNGLVDRRVLLSQGAMLAGAMSVAAESGVSTPIWRDRQCARYPSRF